MSDQTAPLTSTPTTDAPSSAPAPLVETATAPTPAPTSAPVQDAPAPAKDAPASTSSTSTPSSTSTTSSSTSTGTSSTSSLPSPGSIVKWSEDDDFGNAHPVYGTVLESYAAEGHDGEEVDFVRVAPLGTGALVKDVRDLDA